MEKRQEFITHSADETKKAGFDFSKNLAKGDVVLLEGNLGAGKTTFVQGVADGLNIAGRMISPTFVIVRSHKGKLKGLDVNIYHVDLYRIENEDEIKNLGLEEIFEDKNGIVLIEWGKKSDKIKYTWEVKFEIKNTDRSIQIIKNE